MQFSVLRSNTRARIGVPASDALHTDTNIGGDVNAAIQYIDSMFDWPWLEKEASITLVSGTKTYSVPTDWLRTVGVVVSDYPELEKVDIGRLRMMPASSGRPFFYSCFADTLEVRPVPDTGAAAMTTKHLYIKRETALSADADTPAMPDVYQWVIVEYAAYLAFRRSGKAADAAAAVAEVEKWMQPWLASRPARYSPDLGGGVVPPVAAAAVQPNGKPA